MEQRKRPKRITTANSKIKRLMAMAVVATTLMTGVGCVSNDLKTKENDKGDISKYSYILETDNAENTKQQEKCKILKEDEEKKYSSNKYSLHKKIEPYTIKNEITWPDSLKTYDCQNNDPFDDINCECQATVKNLSSFANEKYTLYEYKVTFNYNIDYLNLDYYKVDTYLTEDQLENQELIKEGDTIKFVKLVKEEENKNKIVFSHQTGLGSQCQNVKSNNFNENTLYKITNKDNETYSLSDLLEFDNENNNSIKAKKM